MDHSGSQKKFVVLLGLDMDNSERELEGAEPVEKVGHTGGRADTAEWRTMGARFWSKAGADPQGHNLRQSAAGPVTAESVKGPDSIHKRDKWIVPP